MGYRIAVTCHACEFEEIFYLGQSKKDTSLDAILSYFAKEEQEYIMRCSKENDILSISFFRELGMCEECSSLQIIPILKMYTSNDKIISVTGTCTMCNSNLKLIPTYDIRSDMQPELKCLHCQAGCYEFKDLGLWD